METVARLFLCARCRVQVCICSHCDRSQQYCGEDCALTARQLSLKAAGRRYQSTRRGRAKHAERMRRYRAKEQIVTHHSSPTPVPDVLLLLCLGVVVAAAIAVPAVTAGRARRCHFCGRPCSVFMRLNFLCGRVAQAP